MDFRQRAASTALDGVAVQIVPQIGGVYSEPFWTVAKISRRFGSEPSSIMIEVPTSGWGGKAPLIAGVQDGGPLNNAKIFKRVTAVLNGAVLFNGSVVAPDESFDTDSAAIECLDDRYLLEGVNIVGSFWRGDDDKCAYREGIPAWFNKDGMPNRIKGDGTLTYAFCESNFGLDPGEQPGDPKFNFDQAQHWTPDSIMVYLAETTNKPIASKYVSPDTCPEYTFCPDSVVFPKGVASALISFSTDAETPELGLRKAAEVIYDATPLNLAIQKLCEMAGPLAMAMSYEGFDKSTIAIVQSRYTGGGLSLQRATGKDTDAFVVDGKVVGGGIKRDGRKLFTQSVVSGDLVYIESRVASTDQASIAAQQAAGVELITAWDSKTVDDLIVAYNKAYDASLNPKLSEYIEQYPLVMEAWRLNPEKQFSDGTSEGSHPWCKTTNRKILPHMLTRFMVREKGKTPYELKTGFQPYWLEFAETTTTDVPAGPGSAQAPATGGENGNTPPAPGNPAPTWDGAAAYAQGVANFNEDFGNAPVEGNQGGGNEEG